MADRVRNRLCPECGAGPFAAQGLSGHLRMAHGMTSTQARDAMKRSPVPADVLGMWIACASIVPGRPDLVQCGACKQLISLSDELKAEARETNGFLAVRCPTQSCAGVVWIFVINEDGTPQEITGMAMD